MRFKVITRLTFLGSLLAWVALTFFDLVILFSDIRSLEPDIPIWLPRIILVLYVILLFYYYTFKISKKEGVDFTDLLYQVFTTGLLTILASLVVRLILFLLGDTTLVNNVLFINFIYQINLALFINFLVATFMSWRRLILYQKSKGLIQMWRIFELILLFALLYDSLIVNVDQNVGIVIMLILGAIGLFLSINVKWIAYLNFRQKWKSLILLSCVFFYLFYFLYTVTQFSDIIGTHSASFIDFKVHAFSLSTFGFVMLYNLFSFLVILFNLPTSSAFEQKMEESVNFRRISQAIQTEKNEESVYNLLLESSISSVFANAAFLEIDSTNAKGRLFIRNIQEHEMRLVQKYMRKKAIKKMLNQNLIQGHTMHAYMHAVRVDRFRSLLVFPLIVRGEIIGFLTLLKELPDNFNKEMIRIISTFVNQTSISIENFRLLEEALQNESYKQELKIASEVQKILLPTTLNVDENFTVSIFSRSEDRVGGDYYDTVRMSSNKVALIIADVSGKGTTAAFHMSQMKGIFHSLARQDMNPYEFMYQANRVLVSCLERKSFISAIYLVVDTQNKKAIYARAGHCPVLYYNAETDLLEYLKDRGMVLGVIKDQAYCELIDVQEITYSPGDIMVLYTDGITETKGMNGEEYGYARLKSSLVEVMHKGGKEIQEHLITKLYDYSGTHKILDDYTAMIIKF